eukprot:7384679-Prymnesium_polylepis.1
MQLGKSSKRRKPTTAATARPATTRLVACIVGMRMEDRANKIALFDAERKRGTGPPSRRAARSSSGRQQVAASDP